MQYHGATYAEDAWDVFWYEKNIFGDIVAVYDDAGTKLIMYYYDAFGYCIAGYDNNGSSTQAYYNPFRYRGYYYDRDLDLYYLNARYYDGRTGRFISPDHVEYLGANGDLNSYNLYAYCSNNPVMYADPEGNLPFFLFTGLLGAALGLVITAVVDFVPDKEFDLHWGWYVFGFGIGSLAGVGTGMAISYSATGTVTATFTNIKFSYALKAAQKGNYDKLAKFGTHNNNSKQVGLGKYIEASPNSYEVLSKKYGYTYYEIEAKYWNKMSNVLGQNAWNVNKAFLDQQISLGKTFVKLSADYSGYYLKELIYLGLL